MVKVIGISELEEVWTAVDRVCSKYGMSRSEFVGEALRESLKKEKITVPDRPVRGRPVEKGK